MPGSMCVYTRVCVCVEVGQGVVILCYKVNDIALHGINWIGS